MPMEKRNQFLPLSRPSIGDAEIEAAVACLRSGRITTGPRCAELETKFASAKFSGIFWQTLFNSIHELGIEISAKIE